MNEDRSKIAQRAEEPEFRREGYETLPTECTNSVGSVLPDAAVKPYKSSARRAQAGD